MTIRVDATELAREIAHREVLHTYAGTVYINEEDVFTKDEEGKHVYTEKAQDVFNDLYDFWLSFIIKHETNEGHDLNLI